MREITCTEFEDWLSGWLEHELEPETAAAMEAHADRCAACGDLTADLRTISSEARALPELQPSRDLWAGIAERIQAPVLPLASAPRPRVQRRFGYRAMAAAAAALVIATAGVTWLATVSTMERQSRVAVRGGAETPELGGPAVDTPRLLAGLTGDAANGARAETDSRADNARGADTAERNVPAGRAGQAERRGQGAVPARRAGAQLASRATASELPSPDGTYGTEIQRLHGVLRERRGELDSATVAILEHNLKVIDDAIAQSRAALAKDPASRFLYERLTDALDTKLELLRTATMLPART